MRRTLPDTETLLAALEPLFRERAVRLAVLFGSAASGRVHPHSDLDLALDCGAPFDVEEFQGRIIDALRDDRVDLVDLRRADPVLAFQIAKGRPLYEAAPGAFRAFALSAWKRRIDYEPYLQFDRRYIREKKASLQ